ncbi:T9SS type A sorting domain-containing protein [Labilibacter sediminis]|nr:T9SS type A sorting domain-containing protein [Labilibacter sediminis]
MKKSLLFIAVLICSIASVNAQDNLISNPTIVDGTGYSSKGTSFSYDGESHTVDGSFSAKVVSDGKKGAFGYNVQSAIAIVDTTMKHDASLWVKQVSGDAATIKVRIEWDSDGTQTPYQGSTLMEEKELTVGEWVQFKKENFKVIPKITHSSNGTGEEVKGVSLVVGVGNVVGEFLVDDLFLSQNIPTGIEEVEVAKLNVTVSPDGNKLGILGSNEGLVEIYNVSGRMVKQQLIGQTNTVIDISNLNKGLYILKLNNATAKIVK